MALDSTLISGLATAAATVAAGWLMRVGRKRRRDDEDTSLEDDGVVSLTKQLMVDKNRDLDRSRRRIAQLESREKQLLERVDQLQLELDYAHSRIVQLGGP